MNENDGASYDIAVLVEEEVVIRVVVILVVILGIGDDEFVPWLGWKE